jgi:hypothetical protein
MLDEGAELVGVRMESGLENFAHRDSDAAAAPAA